jgi:hypothetical protein
MRGDYRQITMRRLLPVLTTTLLALALGAGCGARTGDDVGAASGPASPSGTPSERTPSDSRLPSAGPVDFELVAILTGTAAGGTVDPTARPLRTPDEVSALADEFPRAGFAQQIRSTIASTDVPSGQVLVGAVVSIGCEVPSQVTVSQVADRLLLEAVPGKSSPQECFAAMTSVALVLVGESLVPPVSG